MRRFVLLSLLLVSAAQAQEQPAAKPFLVLDTGGHSAPIFRAVFSPDGEELITVSLDKTIRFWDVNTGRSLRVLRPPLGPNHQGELNALALSPDGHTLAVTGFGYRDKETRFSPIFLIDRTRGAITRALRAHAHTVQTLVFSHDGTRLASGGEDQGILIWDVATGQVVKKLEGHTGPITALAFSPDGKKLVSAGSPPHSGGVTPDRVAWLWSVATGKVLTKREGAHDRVVRRVAWSPDGMHIATGSQADPGDNFVALWDADGKLITRIRYPANRRMGCESVAFTPDSKNLVLSLRDGFYVSAGVYSLSGSEARLFISGNQNEEAGESPSVKHGFFTQALLEGLRGKSRPNREGLVHLTGLHYYVEDKVSELSHDEQHVAIDRPSTVTSFPLTKPEAKATRK